MADANEHDICGYTYQIMHQKVQTRAQAILLILSTSCVCFTQSQGTAYQS